MRGTDVGGERGERLESERGERVIERGDGGRE